MSRTIDYYLALTSPWTYLAGPRFKDLVEGSGATVTWKPYNIMQVFKLNGTKMVKERPKPVQANRLNELRRWRDHLGMKLNLQPQFFPVDHSLGAKAVIAARREGADVMDLANAILRAVWAEERNIAEAETVAAIAAENGFDGAALLATAERGEATGEYQKNTEDAIANNVFGSPTWICDGELFWGQDRLDFLAQKVRG